MLRYVCLLLLIFQWRINFADAAYADTFKRCCDLGTKWAEEDLNCSTFPTPVAGIAAEQQAICLSSVGICCSKKHRESQCNAGHEAAKAGKDCTPKVRKPGSENFKDCCEGCTMGIIVASNGGPCDPKSFGPPWDVSFLACCRELLPTTTEATTTSTTTETTPTTTEKVVATTDVSTTTQNSRNKLAPPPPPPLESLCDTLSDELCAHVCVPIPGSYRCECRKGFTLMDDGKSCQQRDVSDRCKINNPCDQQCFDTGVAVRCSCNSGFKLNPDKITCRDIDECKENIHKCDPTQICVNVPGIYDCIDPEDNIADEEKDKCPLGYKYDTILNVCDDLDECKLFLDQCEDGKTCENTIGSYTCTDNPKNKKDDLECPYGFYYKASIESCADIDECATGEDDCNKESQICLNIQGGFTCQDRASKKTCPAGFKINMIGICGDIDECKENVEICSTTEKCINEQGGYRCVPKSEIDETNETSVESTTPLNPPPASKNSTPLDSSNQQPPLEQPFPIETTSEPTPPVKTTPTVPTYVPSPRYPTYNHPPAYNPYNPYLPPKQNPYNPNNLPQSPVPCKAGFKYVPSAQRCIDIDECTEEESACDSNQECRNSIGSYTCICKLGFQLDSVTGACTDINECQTDSHDCVHSQRCDNTIGSYQCVRYTSCGTGYTLNAASGLCEDDDECTLGTDDCNILGPNYQCRNTLGSFRCERKRCMTSNCYETRPIFTIPATRVFIPASRNNNNNNNNNNNKNNNNNNPLTTVQLKQCLPGYVKNTNGYCDDINECDQSPCAKHQRCLNTNGSFRCLNLINCSPGYNISADGTFCEDIDECESGTHTCTGQQQCINREGYHICQCPPGHKANKANQCEDINECEFARGQLICGRNADCENTIGSYRCRCKDGFRETNNGKSCVDINECQEITGLCAHQCYNVWGSYKCTCKQGFTINSDNRTCTDVNECEKFKDNELCTGICENTLGSYSCTCPEGYRIGTDGRTCIDIDECERGNICPSPDDICWNVRGSYRCNSIHCPQNYIRDPVQKNRCKRKAQMCDSRDLECMRQPSTYSYNFITFVSRLPLPEDGQLDLFTMRGPQWDTTTTFNMDMLNVRCPHGIPKADKNYFRMRRSSINEVVLSLVKVIEGPQEAELQLTMEVYHNGEYKGSVVAKVFIIVTQYEY